MSFTLIHAFPEGKEREETPRNSEKNTKKQALMHVPYKRCSSFILERMLDYLFKIKLHLKSVEIRCV